MDANKKFNRKARGVPKTKLAYKSYLQSFHKGLVPYNQLQFLKNKQIRSSSSKSCKWQHHLLQGESGGDCLCTTSGVSLGEECTNEECPLS